MDLCFGLIILDDETFEVKKSTDRPVMFQVPKKKDSTETTNNTGTSLNWSTLSVCKHAHMLLTNAQEYGVEVLTYLLLSVFFLFFFVF